MNIKQRFGWFAIVMIAVMPESKLLVAQVVQIEFLGYLPNSLASEVAQAVVRPVVSRNHVYYTEAISRNQQRLIDYDLATGTKTVVMSETDQQPGGTEPYGALYPYIAADGEDVVFATQGVEPNFERLLFARIDNQIVRIADGQTPVPGGQGFFGCGPFYDLYRVGIEKGTVVFNGTSTVEGEEGIYRYAGGQLSVIADNHTLDLVTGLTLHNFEQPQIHNGTVAFFAAPSTLSISFAEDAALFLANDQGLVSPIRYGDAIANTTNVLKLNSGTGIEYTLGDEGIGVMGGYGPSNSDEEYSKGVFHQDSELQWLFDQAPPLPGVPPDTLNRFVYSLASMPGGLFFSAIVGDSMGLYTSDFLGHITELVGPGDFLAPDWQVPSIRLSSSPPPALRRSFAYSGPQATDGKHFAFAVEGAVLKTRSQPGLPDALYYDLERRAFLLTVPEPATWALALAGAGLLAAYRLRQAGRSRLAGAWKPRP